MLDNKTFGSFIREKRIEKGLKQKELADLLYVTESAVSKWETGRSYPDITMIPNLCSVLGVTEKELIDGANDTEYRKMRRDATLYNRIAKTCFWSLTISYAIALFVCVICDLAVNNRLSFSVIVFSSLLVAYSFAPTWTRFSEHHKLALFVGTTYASLCLLFGVCCIRTGGSWFAVASAGVLLGYAALFLPFLFRRYLSGRFSRILPLLYFTCLLACLLLLLFVIRTGVAFPYFKAVLISAYSFIPFFIIALMHMLDISRLLKAAVDVLAFGITGYRVQAVASRLFGGDTEAYYKVDFGNWADCVNGNVAFITLMATIAAAAILVGIYFIRRGGRTE